MVQMNQKKELTFSTPDAYLANWRQAMGTRFSADGMYMGENRGFGAMLSYSVNKELVEALRGQRRKRRKNRSLY